MRAALIRLLDRATAEFFIALLIIIAFLVAYFVKASEQMEGTLIAAFAGAWGYYLGNAIGQRRALEQAGDSTSLARSAVRGMSRAFERDATSQLPRGTVDSDAETGVQRP